MGSDDIFHRRKAKRAHELARKVASRESYEKALLVCEGEKTEPYYFNDLKNHLKLNSTNIIVTGDCDSDPLSIVKYAIQNYAAENAKGDPFDKVFCIFDKDSHANYDNAIQLIGSQKPKDTYFAINSVPCFEYWLLLHFTYTTKPYTATKGKSCCETLIAELQTFISGYNKGSKTIFNDLFAQLPQAKAFSARALAAAQVAGTDNPGTKVHELVEYLENINH